MKSIKQRHNSSCGPTCLAMILGVSYEKALKIAHPNHKKGKSYSTLYDRIAKVLDKYNIEYEIKHPRNLPMYKNEKAIIYIGRKHVLTKGPYAGMFMGHWIVWDPEKQEFLDPGTKRHLNYYKAAYLRGIKLVFKIKR